MNTDTQKTITLSKLDKLDKLDQTNQQAHKKFSSAIIKLIDAKSSNSGLKYLDPEFYIDQIANTITVVEDDQVSVISNRNDKFVSDKTYKKDLEIAEKPFKYIDTYAKDVVLMNRLQSIFKEVLDEYIDYANYINKIKSKKHK